MPDYIRARSPEHKQERMDAIMVERYTDMFAAGIVDPAKVTRSALENAASVGSCNHT